MMTVHAVSRLTGVSVRTLQYYDNIGLLKASAHTEAGYRLYDDDALSLLQQILLFRELEFSLKDIRQILSSPDYHKAKALEQQITLLEMKRERLDRLILLARGLKLVGGKYMEFQAFDRTQLDDYARQAKETWGKTAAYQEFEEKQSHCTPEESGTAADDLMAIFGEMGAIKGGSPAAPAAQALVRKLQHHITAHFYQCTNEILMQLGQMYAGGGDFTANIDGVGGPGTAAFANQAIQAYCRK